MSSNPLGNNPEDRPSLKASDQGSNQPENDQEPSTGPSDEDWDKLFNPDPGTVPTDTDAALLEALGIEPSDNPEGLLESALEQRLPPKLFALLAKPGVEAPLGLAGSYEQLASSFEFRVINGSGDLEWHIPSADMLGASDVPGAGSPTDGDPHKKYTAVVNHNGRHSDSTAPEVVTCGQAKTILIKRSTEDGGGFDMHVQVGNRGVVNEMLARIEENPKSPAHYRTSYARHALDLAVKRHIEVETGGEILEGEPDYIKIERQPDSDDGPILYDVEVVLPSLEYGSKGDFLPAQRLAIRGLAIDLGEARLFRFEGGKREILGPVDIYEQ